MDKLIKSWGKKFYLLKVKEHLPLTKKNVHKQLAYCMWERKETLQLTYIETNY